LIFEPKDIEKLKENFIDHIKYIKKINKDKKLMPETLHSFLEKELNNHFALKAYLLDPKKSETPQELSGKQEPLPSYPFAQLFRVDIIDAQRGFSDPNSVQTYTSKNCGNLSVLLNKYYHRHLDPSEFPEDDDISALEAIDEAKQSFDVKLNKSFEKALGELKGLGYPGFNDPEIRLSSKIEPLDNLNHEAAIQFGLSGKSTEDYQETALALPEKYNGLGYKNLIDMVFRLISFRDHWMRVGKAGKRRTEKDAFIEPLHLVLIEEPEAHLHTQVQQVFIRKAFEILRNHEDLKGKGSRYHSQLVVSTHSSYLAHEIGFEKLRYFKRKPADSSSPIPFVEVVDLSETFGESSKTDKNIQQTAEFVARYLKTTHCDLFFANGIILVEGAAERILLPHFIRTKYDDSLNRNYISILEVGGAHAHKLRPLIDKLGVPALVITDTDSAVCVCDDNGKNKRKPVRPERDKNYIFSNDTLKIWLGLNGKSLDEALYILYRNKVINHVRFAYQYGIQVEFNGENQKAIPYTFEDAMALSNIALFKKLKKPTGMIKKMKDALSKETLDSCCEELFNSLSADKAEMALDLLFDVDPKELNIPQYIKEGLDWLKKELEEASRDFIETSVDISKN
jgi:predicted ATP-dependent endonuclease of OLD family